MSEVAVARFQTNGLAKSGLLSMTVAEALYLAAFFLFLVQGFLDTTMFAYAMPASIIPAMKGIALALVVLKMAISDFSSRITHVLVTLLLLLVSGLSMLYDGYAAPMQFLVMVAGASGVDFERIAKVYFWSSVVLTFATFAAAFGGIIQNVAVPRSSGTVYAYGFYYSTEFSAHVLSITLAWLYLQRRNLSVRVYLPALLWSALVFVLTDGRLSFGLSVLMVAMVALSDFHRKQRKGAYRYPRVLATSFVVMAAISIILMVTFYDTGILAWLNDLLTNRLYYAHKGFIYYGVSAFGQQIDMTGWGGGRVVWLENYFYIDCSYVNILLRFGYVILLLVLVLCTVPYFRLRKDAGVVAWLLFGIALASFINEHLMGIPYNFFVLMAFAECADYRPRQAKLGGSNATLRGRR